MDKCCAGCKVYHGGEVRHIKECVFYKESFSEMYDTLVREKKELLDTLKHIEAICDNQNDSHENIWKLAYKTIEDIKNGSI